MNMEALCQLVVATLEDMKGKDIEVIDVRDKTPITDYLVIASGTSDRHVKSLAENVVYKVKAEGLPVLGTEGIAGGEWALVDLNGVVVHVMQAGVRAFYSLEKLWTAPVATTRAAQD